MAKCARLIAVVDDDPLVLRALKRLLGAWSYRAETYEPALEFLATLGDHRPDCLIVDRRWNALRRSRRWGPPAFKRFGGLGQK
jgi:FixJ family two-component response regulator